MSLALLLLALALADSVILFCAESTEAIVAPEGMPSPLTSMPAASVLVEERLVIEVFPSEIEPMMSPGENVSGMPVPGLTAFVRVISVAELTEAIWVPASMPEPVTSMPRARPWVVERLVIELELGLPVMAPAEKVSVTLPTDVAWAFADSVIAVADPIDRTTVPSGMPTPVTRIPTRRPLVVGRLVTVGLLLDVLPVMASAENESGMPTLVAVIRADSVIVRPAESID